MAQNEAPTPQKIDSLAARFDQLRQRVKTEAGKLDLPKEELLALANQWGKVTRRARKSFRLEGIVWYILATYGQRTEIKREAVQKLQTELVACGHGRSFKKFFQTDMVYVAAPNAVEAIKAIPRPDRRRMLRLYRTCFELKPAAPSLEVKRKDGVRVVRRARKAAAAA